MASEAAVQERPTQARREEDPDAIQEAREMGHARKQREEAAE